MSAIETSVIPRANFNRIERVPAAVFDTFLDTLVNLHGDIIKSVSTAISDCISDIWHRRDLHSKGRDARRLCFKIPFSGCPSLGRFVQYRIVLLEAFASRVWTFRKHRYTMIIVLGSLF